MGYDFLSGAIFHSRIKSCEEQALEGTNEIPKLSGIAGISFDYLDWYPL
jgi:hypothetical protein